MRILIVEDEEPIAHSLKLFLEKHGNAVDFLLDGKSGERRMATRRDDYDFLILDLTLPEKNGFEVCQSLRKLGITTPILILTGRNNVQDKVLALDSGADDYIVKPFSPEELLARIRAIYRRPVGSFVETLQVRDLTLDPGTREVHRDGKKIELTLKEFELLQYLMRHPDQAINREDLFAHLWDFSDNSLSNIIDAHMKNLRKKVDAEVEEDEKLLETVRGIGYKIRT
jgi:two-component system OmpR family response regulator